MAGRWGALSCTVSWPRFAPDLSPSLPRTCSQCAPLRPPRAKVKVWQETPSTSTPSSQREARRCRRARLCRRRTVRRTPMRPRRYRGVTSRRSPRRATHSTVLQPRLRPQSMLKRGTVPLAMHVEALAGATRFEAEISPPSSSRRSPRSPSKWRCSKRHLCLRSSLRAKSKRPRIWRWRSMPSQKTVSRPSVCACTSVLARASCRCASRL